MKPRKSRVDALLVERGFADDLRVARGLLMAGRVMITEPNRGERKIEKAGEPVDVASSLRLVNDHRRFVSRAGDKLDGALDAFGLDVTGLTIVDLGLSTGGFTDCLLTRGVARVHGVDLAQGIVDWKLRTDDRLVLHERTDARTVTREALGIEPDGSDRVDGVTIDVSLVSLTDILGAAAGLLDPGGFVVALIKPQYEVLPSVLVDGIVEDDAARAAAIDEVTAFAGSVGLDAQSVVASSVRGTKGNQEHLAHFVRRAP
jgi:23S rRNA (cytidine1920-2'-O)/16S rRNA (cytidine1409-2'-O)-methyltransferase